LGLSKELYLGNLYAKRDWGHAKDYVEMQWKILQHKKPMDFVIATGKAYSIKEFINLACKILNIKNYWSGRGINEVCYEKIGKKKKIFIRIDKKYFRPLEVEYLKGDPSLAHKIFKFKPKYNFKSLVHEMIKMDMLEAQKK